MGKQGPCYHCGVTSTPLWRNGPPEKPVLCNACGSRWRTKGTLAKYTPLHARAEVGDHEDRKASSIRSMSLNKTKETKTLKRKPIPSNVIVKRAASDFTQGLKKVVDEDTSNRSSSGSAISNSESCAQLGSTDGSDFTDPAQSSGWETIVPSKKRTCVGRPKPSPVEKLTKDLYMILQEQQSSCFSSSFEEDLIFENDTPTVSVEIGHGSVLMRHPHLSVREEESEASSLSVENKIAVNVSCSNRMKLVADNVVKDPTLSGHRAGKAKNFSEQGTQQERLKMNKSKNEKLQILGSHSSPLRSLDLGDIINFEVFSVQFTTEEQEQLMKFVPSQDTYNLPDSLRSMFDSPQLKENFSFFQHLLVEGVFDSTLSGTKDEDCSMLKKHALLDTTKSHLTECYSQLMKRENDYRGSSPRGTDSNALKNLSAVARACGNQKKKFSETRDLMMSPKRIVKPSFGTNKPKLENEALCISSKGLFAVPQEGCSVMSSYEISDNDLLLDVPSYGSFPLAELLHQL